MELDRKRGRGFTASEMNKTENKDITTTLQGLLSTTTKEWEAELPWSGVER